MFCSLIKVALEALSLHAYAIAYPSRSIFLLPQVSKTATFLAVVFFNELLHKCAMSSSVIVTRGKWLLPFPEFSSPNACALSHCRLLSNRQAVKTRCCVNSKKIQHLLRFVVYGTNCGFGVFTIYLYNLVYWVGFGTGMTFQTHLSNVKFIFFVMTSCFWEIMLQMQQVSRNLVVEVMRSPCC